MGFGVLSGKFLTGENHQSAVKFVSNIRDIAVSNRKRQQNYNKRIAVKMV
jgi:hypothetical protein